MLTEDTYNGRLQTILTEYDGWMDSSIVSINWNQIPMSL